MSERSVNVNFDDGDKFHDDNYGGAIVLDVYSHSNAVDYLSSSARCLLDSN